MSCPPVDKLRNLSMFAAALLTILAAGCESSNSSVGFLSHDSSASDPTQGKANSAEVRKANEVTVTVKGAVVKPGVYVLNTGASVAEAIVEAGGLTDQAILTRLNLKSPVRDKMILTVPKVSIPTFRQAASPVASLSRSPMGNGNSAPPALPVPAVPPAKIEPMLKVTVRRATIPAAPQTIGPAPVPVPLAPEAAAEAAPSERVSINRATAEQLQRLPGIGPSLATRIVAYRNEVGAFRSPEQLMDVKGISPEKFSLIQSLIQTN